MACELTATTCGGSVLVSETVARWPEDTSEDGGREAPFEPEPVEWSTATRPSVTSTSTAVASRRTLKTVPTARTSTPPARTINGREDSFATVKSASPRTSVARRSIAVNSVVTTAP